jgi:general secretion pathway protein G
MNVRTAAGPSRTAGFTLIELLVVFSILALLLTLATPRYFKALDGGKEKVQAQNLATLRDAIDKFRADQGKYPAQLQEVVDKRYLREVPLDPVSGSRAWETLPFPNSAEPGIYDVRAPAVAGPLPVPESATSPTPGAAP